MLFILIIIIFIVIFSFKDNSKEEYKKDCKFYEYITGHKYE